MNKLKLLFGGLLMCSALFSFTQTQERPNSIEVRYGAQDSFGPFEEDGFPLGIGNGDNWDEVFKLNYNRYMNDFIDLGFGITAGSVDNLYDEDFNGSNVASPNLLDRGSVADVDFLVRYKFYNGDDFKTNALLKAFLYTGISGTYVSELEQVRSDLDNGFSTNFPLGLGLMGGTDKINLNVQSGMRFGMWDKIPDRWEHSVGLGFGFGPAKESKNVDLNVPMPPPPPVEEVVEEPEVVEVIEVEEEVMADPVPREEVVLMADSDGDGIPDKEDDCPNEAGTINGCPDADGDGIADKDDNCPETAGVSSNSGCPEVKDADGDGIPDSADKCPTVAGVSANNGCPEVKEETVTRLAAIAKQIQFETGSSNLTANSKVILNEVASIMAANPGYTLSIEGHTDSVGAADFNQGLSERRAASVRDYLAGRGVSSVSSIGYGESKPIASNDNSAGRAQNRRVELKLNPR